MTSTNGFIILSMFRNLPCIAAPQYKSVRARLFRQQNFPSGASARDTIRFIGEEFGLCGTHETNLTLRANSPTDAMIYVPTVSSSEVCQDLLDLGPEIQDPNSVHSLC